LTKVLARRRLSSAKCGDVVRQGSLPLRVVVAGGSIGGLCAGIALRGIGCEVQVYERTPGAMASRGAGIVIQDDLLHLQRRHGAAELPAVSCLQRQYLLPQGGDGVATAMPQRFTSWYAIYRTLRSAFPEERYHPGSTLTGFTQADGSVVARFAERGKVEADLLVCADGSQSETRRRLLPEVEPRYAGYVAWRGTLEEECAPPELVRFFDQSFTFCEARSGGHILCYFIPGSGAATELGRRRLNWVWYVNVANGPELKRLLTDRTGTLHGGSVPAGMVPAELTAEVHAAAADQLHPRFVELVQRTPDPFIQSILDVVVPRMAFGRVCLLGDAAFVLRPHAAAATAKAAADATTLAAALAAAAGDPDGALQNWEARQLEYGHRLVNYGVGLGRRSVQRHDGSHPITASLRDLAERFDGIAQPPRRE
jgi:2-polyprenyl-6-methoxyphenol hydroxylase-like FAD-dependent oxidoreductase